MGQCVAHDTTNEEDYFVAAFKHEMKTLEQVRYDPEMLKVLKMELKNCLVNVDQTELEINKMAFLNQFSTKVRKFYFFLIVVEM